MFAQIGKRFAKIGRQALVGTQKMADIVIYNNKLEEDEKILSGLYARLGKSYYELHKESPQEEFSNIFELISECRNKISETKEKISKLKGLKKCSSCNADVDINAVFCSSCGLKIEDAVHRDCPNCGVEMQDDVCFKCEGAVKEISCL